MIKEFLEKAKRLADLQTLIDSADKMSPEEFVKKVGKLYNINKKKGETGPDYQKRVWKYIKDKNYLKDV